MEAIKEDKDLVLFNQVMALSNLDICKLLSEIEALNTYIQFDSVRVVVPDGDDYYFDPLANNDQCIELMIKHDVERTWAAYDFIGWSYHVLEGSNPIHVTERQDFDGKGDPDISMQKAVCLAVILNKHEKFKLN